MLFKGIKHIWNKKNNLNWREANNQSQCRWEKEKFDNCEQHCERYKFVFSKIWITSSTSTSTSMVIPVNSIVWCRFERLLDTAKVLGPAEVPPR